MNQNVATNGLLVSMVPYGLTPEYNNKEFMGMVSYVMTPHMVWPIMFRSCWYDELVQSVMLETILESTDASCQCSRLIVVSNESPMLPLTHDV